MIRTLVLLLVMALLATVPGSAQCIVRCASPVSTPPCHHHSPANQTQPAQVCATAMLPGAARLQLAHAVTPAAPVMVAVAPMAATHPPEATPLYQRGRSAAPTVLRI
jgi:hypothetical protein